MVSLIFIQGSLALLGDPFWALKIFSCWTAIVYQCTLPYCLGRFCITRNRVQIVYKLISSMYRCLFFKYLINSCLYRVLKSNLFVFYWENFCIGLCTRIGKISNSKHTKECKIVFSFIWYFLFLIFTPHNVGMYFKEQYTENSTFTEYFVYFLLFQFVFISSSASNFIISCYTKHETQNRKILCHLINSILYGRVVQIVGPGPKFGPLTDFFWAL